MQEIQNKLVVGSYTLANYEEIKKELEQSLKDYTVLVIQNDDDYAKSKELRAKLNKAIESIDSERKKAEKQYLEPFNVGKNQIKDLIYQVKKKVEDYGKEIEMYEATLKEEKYKELEKYYYESSLRIKDFTTFELVLNQHQDWLNKSCGMAKIEKELEALNETFINDNVTIDRLYKGKYRIMAKQIYAVTLSLNTVYDKVDFVKSMEEVVCKELEKEDVKQVKFTVDGSIEEIKALSKFLRENEYDFKEEI